MAPIRRLVVDVLKPHEPSLVEFTETVADVGGVAGVTTSVIELDTEVQNLKLTVAGEDLDVEAIRTEIEGLGGTVHSVDQVSCGDRVVDEPRTPQDQ